MEAEFRERLLGSYEEAYPEMKLPGSWLDEPVYVTLARAWGQLTHELAQAMGAVCRWLNKYYYAPVQKFLKRRRRP